ncbi:MAG: hypothetical protein WD049_00610 [Candidatus Paceibacterota bacterium]
MLDVSIKTGNSEEIAGFVDAETTKRRGIAGSLRTAVQLGTLFCVPNGDSYDEKLVAAAIFVVLMDDINVNNRPLRERQMAEFKGAFKQFGLTDDDIAIMQRHREAVKRLVLTEGENS